jgi:uncharacterized membrane protein YdjX (TVP38/TMEM64 family)
MAENLSESPEPDSRPPSRLGHFVASLLFVAYIVWVTTSVWPGSLSFAVAAIFGLWFVGFLVTWAVSAAHDKRPPK